MAEFYFNKVMNVQKCALRHLLLAGSNFLARSCCSPYAKIKDCSGLLFDSYCCIFAEPWSCAVRVGVRCLTVRWQHSAKLALSCFGRKIQNSFLHVHGWVNIAIWFWNIFSVELYPNSITSGYYKTCGSVLLRLLDAIFRSLCCCWC